MICVLFMGSTHACSSMRQWLLEILLVLQVFIHKQILDSFEVSVSFDGKLEEQQSYYNIS